MKTTVDIPKKMLEDLIRNTSAKTKKDAILTAIREYNYRKQSADLTRILGTFSEIMDRDELEQMRRED